MAYNAITYEQDNQGYRSDCKHVEDKQIQRNSVQGVSYRQRYRPVSLELKPIQAGVVGAQTNQ